MSRIPGRLCSLALALVAAAGCGKSDPAGQVESFLKAAAAKDCARFWRCCTDAQIKRLGAKRFTTQDECAKYSALAYLDELYEVHLAIGEGRMTVDQKAADDCLKALDARACDTAGAMPGQGDPMTLDACLPSKLFPGNAKAGSACKAEGECVKTARCAIADTEGVCVPYQAKGDVCNSNDDCGPEDGTLYCSKRDYHCRERGKLGEDCAFSTGPDGSPALPLELECDPKAGYCAPGTSACTKYPGAGEPCALFVPGPASVKGCDPDPALHLTCDSSVGGDEGTCRPPGKAGDRCGSIDCEVGLFCDRNGSPHTCKTFPGLGESCDGICQPPYICSYGTSTCVAPAKLGEDCSDLDCDRELYCDQSGASETCSAQKDDGATCTTSRECLSGNCGGGRGGGPSVCQPGAPPLCVGR